MSETSVSFEKAKANPAAVFEEPEAVIKSAAFTVDQKVEILRRWEYDASEEAVAEEEGMPGAGDSLLGRIILCLDALTGGLDVEKVGPSKQHGIPD